MSTSKGVMLSQEIYAKSQRELLSYLQEEREVEAGISVEEGQLPTLLSEKEKQLQQPTDNSHSGQNDFQAQHIQCT
jgi:hypothetical protein